MIFFCFSAFLLFMVFQIIKGQEFASEAVFGYYDSLMEGFFPAYQNKSQPVYGTVLSKMIRLYREEVNPLLQYGSDYRKASGEDFVSGEYYYFEDDEDGGSGVEEVAEETKKFKRENWEDPNYLRKYIYQIDSTTTVTNSEINGKELLDMDLSLHKSGEKGDTVIGVGDELTKKLQEEGISVVHDRSVYDVRNGKEERSKAYDYAAEAIEKYLKKYPSIKVVIDLHRDGVKESTKLVTTQNGQKMAQIMFFNGVSRTASNGDLTYLKNPNKKMNLSFSLQLQAQAVKKYPGFTRKIYIKGYRYNLHYRGRSLLVEVGAQNNTVKQAKASMSLLAELLNNVLY